MPKASGSAARRRPVFIADFRPAEQTRLSGDAEDYSVVEEPGEGSLKRLGEMNTLSGQGGQLRALRAGLRYDFPPAGPVDEGGESDGYRYRIPFAAGKIERTFDLIVAFLAEHGYGDVPLPSGIEELRKFRLPPKMRHQLSLFGEDGYVHNPVKILFPTPAGRRGELILELYNERAEGHLLKFHRR